MFGMFKAKSATPVQQGPAIIEAAIAVDCAADTLFGLLNFADPTCWKHAVGTVETVATGRFRLHLDLLPEHVFTIVVSDAEPGRLYAFDTQITPRAGRITHASERYEIAPTGAATCIVRLLTEAHFEAGLPRSEWLEEAALMDQAVHTTLAKLKLHAEYGADAVRNVENFQRAA
ncbi:MAG: hypothetical protein JY451_05190 [Erythrobacter sp.]|nr:MAG: hypothetical protein JY451_05190 [Erythrobacter sp.]